jgi:hypothetical protein
MRPFAEDWQRLTFLLCSAGTARRLALGYSKEAIMAMGPQAMMRSVIANLPEKTGKSLDEWIKIVQRDGPPTAKERVLWLKSKHNVGHVTAQIIVAKAEGGEESYENPDKLVDDLFGGSRQLLKPIYEKILAATKGWRSSEPRPCKTYVPFYARVQFALVKPKGDKQIDLYLALGASAPAKGRLKRTKSRDRMTHVVELSAPGEVDGEVRDWLKQAYEKAA